MESTEHVATEQPVDVDKIPGGISPHNLICYVTKPVCSRLLFAVCAIILKN